MNFNWQKIASRRQVFRREIGYQKPSLVPAVMHTRDIPLTRPYLRDLVWRDSRGKPISLPRVSIIEKYDERGNPKEAKP